MNLRNISRELDYLIYKKAYSFHDMMSEKFYKDLYESSKNGGGTLNYLDHLKELLRIYEIKKLLNLSDEDFRKKWISTILAKKYNRLEGLKKPIPEGRDNQGGAVKSTWVQVNSEARPIFKDPITDSGTKKSAKGLLKVNESLHLEDNVTTDEEATGLLKSFYKDGAFVYTTTFEQIRKKLQ